jgi:mannose-6-phosphate isomerase-like protein (cupin superfamily)
MLKTISVQNAILKARQLAEGKLTQGTNADEFVRIGEADGFKIYVTAGKTIDAFSSKFHENPRDVFMWIMEGKVEFRFKGGRKTIAKSGKFLVLPKHVVHRCIFKEMTIALEGVYERGLRST